MQIKAHQEYDPNNYAGYAITSIKEDFKINLLYPSGFVEYSGYDLYDIGDQILIAFNNLHFQKENLVFVRYLLIFWLLRYWYRLLLDLLVFWLLRYWYRLLLGLYCLSDYW